MTTMLTTLNLVLLSISLRTTFGFTPTVNTPSHPLSKETPLSKITTITTTTSLGAKFRLDNGGEDDYDFPTTNNNTSTISIEPPQRDYEYDYDYDYDYDTSSTTTFGSESVPESQIPANEYLDLISSPFFDWANRPTGSKGLLTRLLVLYSISYGLVCWPIGGATFTMEGYSVHRALSANVGSMGLVFLMLVRLYSGWGYVGSRLQSKTIEFEETGWYDGDIEEKTQAEKARDLLLYRTDVLPAQERLKTFLAATGALLVASTVALNLTFQYKPMFNEYDPAMLERLVYDERVANVAAERSGGVPTYCDSRYYRAIANGGQGCR